MKYLASKTSNNENEIQHILQKRHGEDGLTCIAMMLSYFRGKINFRKFRKCNLSLLGGNAFEDVLNLSQANELEVISINCHYLDLNNLKLPCLIYWRMQRLVVLQKIEKKSYFILDPGNAQIKYREDEFEVYFCEFVLAISEK